MCLCGCMYFQVLTQLGGCSNSSRDERNGSGAVTKRISRGVATHLSDLLILGG